MTKVASNKNKKNLLEKFFATDDGHFAIDTIRNVFWFCIIALSALGLHTLVTWMSSKGVSNFIIIILTGTEYALLIADVIWFISRLAVGTYVAVKATFHEIPEKDTSLTNRST